MLAGEDGRRKEGMGIFMGCLFCRKGRGMTGLPAAAPKTPEEAKPVIEGADNAAALATSRRDSRIRVDVNLVLVPATVTDPMNRLVTGLEKENFEVYDNN